MNVFMLGDFADAQLTADAPKFRDPERPTVFDPTGADTNAGAKWWYTGTGGTTKVGGMPANAADTAAVTTANQYAVARSIATSYTCTQTGCHLNSVFATTVWGTSWNRLVSGTDPAGPKQDITGHSLPGARTASGTWNNYPTGRANTCGPCHPGNAAGLPNWSNATSRMAYGCDQCHDMIGKATNSTAFPHGNRRITVYEWDSTGQIETYLAGGGNLWMYGGNVVRSSAWGSVLTMGGGFINNDAAAPITPTGSLAQFADPNWKVLTNVTGGGTAQSVASTGLMDGACLKCHMAVDPLSLSVNGSGYPITTNVPGVGSVSYDTVGEYGGMHWYLKNQFTNGAPNDTTWGRAQRIFLYK
jgi:hypothetical protein